MTNKIAFDVANFARLTYEAQRVVLGHVGEYLGFTSIKRVVECLNAHNSSSDVYKINVPALLTEAGFIVNVLSFFGKALEQQNYLAIRLRQIVRTQDFQVSRALCSYPLFAANCHNLLPPDYCEILCIGARHGHSEVIHELMKDQNLLTRYNREMAARNAARWGQLEIFCELLRDGFSLSEESLKMSLRFASRNGHLPIIRKLLDHPNVSDHIEEASIDAASFGQIEALRLLMEYRSRGGYPLKRYRRVHRDQHFRLVLYASGYNHYDIVHMLLEKQPLEEFETGTVVQLAAKKGHLKIIQLLLDKDSVNEGELGGAVEKAAKKGHSKVAALLLSQGSISTKALGRAVQGATEKGHPSLVPLLLANGPIDESPRSKSLSIAIQYGYFELVVPLLKNGSIREEERGDGAAYAAWHGNLECVALLLDNGPISDEKRGLAVAKGAQRGNLECVTLLLNNGPISEERRGWGLAFAAKYGHFEVFYHLLKKEGVLQGVSVQVTTQNGPDDYYYKRLEEMQPDFVSAVQSGHIEGIGKMIQEGFYSEALKYAAKSGSLSAVRELIIGRTLSEYEREQAVESAAKKGYFEVAEELLKNEIVNDLNIYRGQPREEAVTSALVNMHVKLVCLLLRNHPARFRELRGVAVYMVVATGDMDTLRELLKNNAVIPEDCRKSAIEKALQSGNPEMLKELQ
jgi:ankyrin repeat protein